MGSVFVDAGSGHQTRGSPARFTLTVRRRRVAVAAQAWAAKASAAAPDTVREIVAFIGDLFQPAG